jgi:hypothetical protein
VLGASPIAARWELLVSVVEASKCRVYTREEAGSVGRAEMSSSECLLLYGFNCSAWSLREVARSGAGAVMYMASTRRFRRHLRRRTRISETVS